MAPLSSLQPLFDITLSDTGAYRVVHTMNTAPRSASSVREGALDVVGKALLTGVP